MLQASYKKRKKDGCPLNTKRPWSFTKLLIRRQKIPITDWLQKVQDTCHCVKGVCIRIFSGPYFPHLNWMRNVFSPNEEKYGPEKLRIRTLFMQCVLAIKNILATKVCIISYQKLFVEYVLLLRAGTNGSLRKTRQGVSVIESQASVSYRRTANATRKMRFGSKEFGA